jgi:hypothetical protein
LAAEAVIDNLSPKLNNQVILKSKPRRLIISREGKGLGGFFISRLRG